MQSNCWATWLLERDDRAARACGLQLARRRLADRQRAERGMGMIEWRGTENHRMRYTHHERVRR